MQRWVGIVLILVLFSCAHGGKEKMFNLELLGTKVEDISYGSDPNQVYDIWYPTEYAGSAWPVVFNIHGGGWTFGHENEGPFGDDPSGCPVLLYNRHLTEHGICVVSIRYRLAPEFVWPTQKLDVIQAIRHFAARAATYHNVDAGRMGIMGGSAGGHITHWVFSEMPLELKAMAPWYAVSRLPEAMTEAWNPDWVNITFRNYSLSAISPLNIQIPMNGRAVFIAQGTNDVYVLPWNSEELVEKYRTCGYRVKYLVVTGGDHTFLNFGEFTPDQDAIRAEVTSFFSENL